MWHSYLLATGAVRCREEVVTERELSAVYRCDDGVRELPTGVALVSRQHDATAGVGAELLHLAIVEQKEYLRHIGRLQSTIHGLSNVKGKSFRFPYSMSRTKNDRMKETCKLGWRMGVHGHGPRKGGAQLTLSYSLSWTSVESFKLSLWSNLARSAVAAFSAALLLFIGTDMTFRAYSGGPRPPAARSGCLGFLSPVALKVNSGRWRPTSTVCQKLPMEPKLRPKERSCPHGAE